MISTYHLPPAGNITDLKHWSDSFPPSQAEIARNNKIKTLQGNDNRFITHPEEVDKIQY
jgi:endonuclease I